MALVLLLTPRPEGERREITLRTLELPAFPITLVLEENEGETAAAWLRTPAGARRIEQVEGLSFISSDPVVSRADQDDSDDLLWRISFMNVKGEGIHLWIGMTTWAPRVYVAATPFQYTRWHALPAKIEVPKGTSLYISPAAPLYRTLLAETGCENGMVARGALGNPWIFREIADADAPPPTVEELAEEMEEHFHSIVDFYGEELALRISRKTLLEYLRGRGYPGELRASISFLNSTDAFRTLMKAVRKGPSPRYWQTLSQNPSAERRLAPSPVS